MIRPIITSYSELKKPCLELEKNENAKEIIQDLKDTLAKAGGFGISANQISIQKKVSYIKIPKKINPQTKKIEYEEMILINPKIIEKSNPIQVQNEGCISFPGLEINTKRYIFITVQFENEKREMQTGIFSDLESIAVQHETDHLNGITILERKWKAK